MEHQIFLHLSPTLQQSLELSHIPILRKNTRPGFQIINKFEKQKTPLLDPMENFMLSVIGVNIRIHLSARK